MKTQFIISLILFLFCLSNNALSNPNSTTEDIFGLKMEVVAPYPDVIEDGVDMDTVRFGHKIYIRIDYQNQTNITQRDFKITAFFPNRVESYTKLEQWNPTPDQVDPDSSRETHWQLGALAPGEGGKIELTLRVNRAPKDTIYLSYGAAAQAKWTPVSQVSHTNIYIPGGGIGIRPYPNLWIEKTDNVEEGFPGDTITYNIHYGNNGEIGGIPAEEVAIIDTLPSNFIFLDGETPSFIDKIPDGRTVLIWELLGILPYTMFDSLKFRVKTSMIADRDSLVVNGIRITSSINELVYIDNFDKEPVWIKPKINLAIEQDGPNEYNMIRDGTQNFRILCKNLSSLDLKNIKVRVKIDDGISEANIYSIQNISNEGELLNDTFITWIIPDILSQDTIIQSFDVIINNVKKSENYSINFKAVIDSLVPLVDKVHTDIDASNNHDEWIVNVDATPDLSINISPEKNSVFGGDTLTFNITCANSSIGTQDEIGVRVDIDDSVAETNIYTIISEENGQPSSDMTRIDWKIPALSKNETKELSFKLTYDRIKKPYRDYPDFYIKAIIDSVETDSLELLDNIDSCEVFIDGTPNLAIEIKEKHNRTSVDPDSTLDFTLLCKNLSSPAFDSINVHAWIDAENIYTITQEGGKVIDNTKLEWNIPPLSFEENNDESKFSITLDKIAIPDNYEIKITAAIDTLEIDSTEFRNNRANWNVTINAAPQISLGPITIDPSVPILRNDIEYTIPFANIGNFPAKNAVMTIDKPIYTYLLYYIKDGSKHNIEDTTSATFQIPLGDLEPDHQETISLGLRIYSYKELPLSVTSPMPLELYVSIIHDDGEVTEDKTDRVYFNPTRADLILDKNIVEPGLFPLKITFFASDFSDAEIKIYNLAGEFIKTVYIGPVERGDRYIYDWSGDNERGNMVSSGVYFIYANSKFYNGFKKVIIVR